MTEEEQKWAEVEQNKEIEEIFIDKDGIKITEDDLEEIFREYFRNTELENVDFQWSEIISSSSWINFSRQIVRLGISNPIEKAEALAQLTSQLKDTYKSATGKRKKKITRSIEENEIRQWILKEGIKYKHLHEAFKNNPQRIVWSYRLDKQKEIPWFGEITNIFNDKFGTNWTPVAVFSFVVGGLLGLVFLGYWFISKIKAIVRNRNVDRQKRT